MRIFVKVEQIFDNPFQSREEYTELETLAKRIAALIDERPETRGLLQVPAGRLWFETAAEQRPIGRDDWPKYIEGEMSDRAELVARLFNDPAIRVQLQFGHRRLRAWRLLVAGDFPEDEIAAAVLAQYADGLMPVDLVEADEAAMISAVYTENSARADLAAVELASLYKKAMKLNGWNQRELAAAWNESRPTIGNRLRLLKLPADLQQANRDGRLSERQALKLIPTLELAQALGDREIDWFDRFGDDLYPPEEIVEMATDGDTELSSVEIARLTETARKHAGHLLPDKINDREYTVDDVVIQASCKGCPRRSQNYCLLPVCYGEKLDRWAIDEAKAAAEELGLPYSDAVDDFLPWAEDYTKGRHIARLFLSENPCEHLVVGYQHGGSAVRPFLGDGGRSYANFDARNTGFYLNRECVVIGHSGKLLKGCREVVEEIVEAEQASQPSNYSSLHSDKIYNKRGVWKEHLTKHRENIGRETGDAFQNKIKEQLAALEDGVVEVIYSWMIGETAELDKISQANLVARELSRNGKTAKLIESGKTAELESIFGLLEIELDPVSELVASFQRALLHYSGERFWMSAADYEESRIIFEGCLAQAADIEEDQITDDLADMIIDLEEALEDAITRRDSKIEEESELDEDDELEEVFEEDDELED